TDLGLLNLQLIEKHYNKLIVIFSQHTLLLKNSKIQEMEKQNMIQIQECTAERRAKNKLASNLILDINMIFLELDVQDENEVHKFWLHSIKESTDTKLMLIRELYDVDFVNLYLSVSMFYTNMTTYGNF
ncbi:hypothetical protein ACJX0J_013610, partial [Zea mays]